MIRLQDHSLPLNPFIYDLKIDLLEFKEETYVVTVVEGIKQPTGQMSSNVKTVESAGFAKLYEIPYKEGFLNLLSPSCMKLFLYFLYTLETDIDYLTLDKAKICTKLNLKERTYDKAISDLVSNSVIQRMTKKHGDYRYWINPRIMFKGDRHSYMRDRLSENCQVVKSFTNKHYIGSVTLT